MKVNGFCRGFRGFKKVIALGVCVAMLGMAGTAQAVLYTVSGSGGGTFGGAPAPPASLYTLDPTTGAATLIGATGTSHVTGLAVHPTTGVLYGVRSDISGSGDTQLLTINKMTGAATVLGTTGHQIPDITFRSDGTLFGWSETPSDALGNDDLLTIDLISGAATKVGDSGVGTSATGLGFDSSDVLWLKNSSVLHTVDPVSGLASAVLLVLNQSPNNILEFDPSTNIPFTITRIGGQGGGTSLLQTFDIVTGNVTLVGDTGVARLSALAFGPDNVAIPEPITAALGLMGLGVLGMATRRRA